MGIARRNRQGHLGGCSVINMRVAQFENRSGITAAHAGCPQHADLGRIQSLLQSRFQCLRPGQFARQTVADANRQRGWGGLAFFHHIKMRIK